MRNELFGWLWILAGAIAGMVIGLRFHQSDWLGGYGAFPRRMIRLGHISFFGLGFINIVFAQTVARHVLAGPLISAASLLLILGGVTMPLCCGLMAWRPGTQPLFAIPVLSVLGGVALLIVGMVTT